ncbi:lipase maturation factor family protein [Microbacterium sp. STN6]|uniref:lipase maturation factor family protein n=1 Tax=Microbacterium sp. STN6 TaxID=2995588 RepID=UPI002260BDDA|nr:lipase maturation factor family protein [Microbacterium sp. STN6]MCX7523025.1 lipase maturation factor family protein [Microbacterium sp. STN6]
MDWFGADGYELARQVLQRGVAAIYLVAFLSTAAQFPALLGEHGLLPVPQFLRLSYAKKQPTLFRWRYSDRLLLTVAWVGAVVAASLVAGLPQLGPPWVPLILFLAIWFGYLSIVNVGQTFYGFGWESLLLEAGFMVAFLGSNETAPPVLIIWLIRWLVFRLEFGAGMIKMRGDRSWRDLTALYYHHETQPMPNPLSRFAHLMPKWFHRVEVLGNHFSQLIVPFFLFAPQPVASVAAAIVMLTQLWLVVTGNFAWLNVITIVLAFAALSDPAAHLVIPAMPAHTDYAFAVAPAWFIVIVIAASLLVVILSWWPARNLVARRQLMNASFNRWHLVNAYGAFGSVTQVRYEIEIEGTDAPQPGPEAEWRAYEFKGKPGDPRRVPRQFAPYHLRLDWLMWFLALGSPDNRWFIMLLGKLLETDPKTLKLLRVDPFHGEPPQWIRAKRYHYRFATRAERRKRHVWWVREEAGMLVPPVSRDALRG